MSPSKLKPKLRMPPSQASLLEQQEAANRLLKLEAWTEEPSNPPPSALAASTAPVAEEPAVEPVVQAPVVAVQPAKVLFPWEGDKSNLSHPYHVIFSERLFQKVDYLWKRNGYKSMREWVLLKLEAECDKELKALVKK